MTTRKTIALTRQTFVTEFRENKFHLEWTEAGRGITDQYSFLSEILVSRVIIYLMIYHHGVTDANLHTHKRLSKSR